MGAYYSVYIGVYLEVQNSKTTQTESYFEDPDTGQEKKTRFDAQTGKEYVSKTRTKEVPVYANPFSIEVKGFDDNEFFAPEYSGAPKDSHTWIPNKKGEYKLIHSGDDVLNFDLSPVKITELTVKFVEKYHKYLEEVRKKFRCDVKFGVVYYAH